MTDKNLSELISSSYQGGNLIDDTANTTTNIWSAVKISNELNSIVIPDTDLTTFANGSVLELQSSTGNNVFLVGANSTTAGLLSAEAQTIGGDKTFTGTITYNGTIDSDFIPDLDITYDLGSANNRWRDLYLSGNTINLGDAQIKADEASGTIALIPPVTVDNPNPSAMVVNALGRMRKVDTTLGVLRPESMDAAANTTDDVFESITVEQHVIANTFVGDGSSITNVDAVTLQGNTVADLRQYADNAAANVSVDLTGYATETYVDTAVSGIVNAAPTTLDTLNELAAALGDDPNFATTITNLIGTKLDTTTWTNSTASGIDATDVSNWNTAYGWGNHASAGYQAAASAITTSNIGSQSVNYAASAGNADTVDGLHIGTGSNSIAYTGSTGNLVLNNPESYSGEVRLGAAWDRGGLYASNNVTVATGAGKTIDFVISDVSYARINTDYFQHNSDVRSPIFYDSNNTGYYVDPSSTSTSVNIAGQINTAKSSGTLYSINGIDSFGYNPTADRGMYIKGTSGTYVYGGGTYYDGSNIQTLLHTGNFSSYAERRVISNDVYIGSAGWYTIATNFGDRASAKFHIRDTQSSRHQSVHFHASHMFGNGNAITVQHTNVYSTSPIRYIRIKEGGTYDGALLQVYFDTATQFRAFMYENDQSSGWNLLSSPVPDGTNPGGVSNFAALTTQAVFVDIDRAIRGGNITTGDIVSYSNITADGNITAGGNVTASSDIRLKSNLKPIDNALNKIQQITGYTFNRIDLNDDKRQAGVIAQEVLKVLPEVVLGDEETQYSVAYGNMVALLIEGVKEQQSTITSLEERINKLENLLEKLT